ncbi:MAG: hypothetical protein VXX06_11010, partial [Pseudomonadota bacterium]|nr:hypothetical protein [Pseudomonadota bacterium]
YAPLIGANKPFNRKVSLNCDKAGHVSGKTGGLRNAAWQLRADFRYGRAAKDKGRVPGTHRRDG